jgi:hypothetical protein
MAGFIPAIHALLQRHHQNVDGRDIKAFTPVFDGLCPANDDF